LPVAGQEFEDGSNREVPRFGQRVIARLSNLAHPLAGF
jgi:hypothetical protein